VDQHQDEAQCDDAASLELSHRYDVELERRACLQLLSTGTIGRLVYTKDALPAVQPVRYIVDGETIVFGSSEATRIVGTHVGTARTAGTVVAFEVDELDPDTGAGWMVTVVGGASILSTTDASRYCPEALRPITADSADGQMVAMSASIVTGHRVTGQSPPRAGLVATRDR
jgi:uncharacterized protein